MRAILGRLSLLVMAAGLVGSASMAGCSSTTDDQSAGSKNEGSIGFRLDAGGGAIIKTMRVVVYGNSLGALGAAGNIVKDLDVEAIPGAVASFTLTLPAGTNYQVKISTPDDTTCAGTGTFNVIAGQSNGSTLSVTMSCASKDVTGGETIDVTACTPPVVNSVFVGPNSQAIGRNIQLMASVETGSTVQWAQSGVGAGTFVSSSAATTNFTCTTAGAITIQLGLTKNGCATTKSYAVSCFNTGTTGGAGAGGAPGAGAGGAPPAGAGGAPPAGAGGAPPAGAGGAPPAGAGGAPPAGAGGAPPAGAGGAPPGGAGGAPPGGAGGSMAGAGGAQCPSPVVVRPGTAAQLCTASYAIDECGLNCAQLTSTACRTCELADPNQCYDDGDNTDGSSLLNISAALEFYGGVSTPARVAAGVAAEACFYTSGCGKAQGAIFTTCYCGTSGAACTTPGSANGPCKAQVEAALETVAPLEVASRIGDPSYPGGIAQIRVGCDKLRCAAACLP